MTLATTSVQSPTIEQLITQHRLTPQTEEGGYFRRVWQSKKHDATGRPQSSMIYYLLPGTEKSRLHKLDCQEVWVFISGSPLLIHQINNNGIYKSQLLGMPDASNNNSPVVVVPAENWFGAEVVDSKRYSFASCTTTPSYQGLQAGCKAELCEQFPQHINIIQKLSN